MLQLLVPILGISLPRLGTEEMNQWSARCPTIATASATRSLHGERTQAFQSIILGFQRIIRRLGRKIREGPARHTIGCRAGGLEHATVHAAVSVGRALVALQLRLLTIITVSAG